MSYVADFLTPDDLKKVSNLQMVARLVVEGFISGMHKSPHKGFSVEFAQHRPYVQGDEIRRLDWKVYGKTDRFYVREYDEETNLRATLLLDLSGSMEYGKTFTKAQYAVHLAAALAYLMMQQRDAVGLATFDTELRRYIPARSSIAHLKVILDELHNSVVGGETDLGSAFRKIAPRLQRRGLIIIISDCYGEIRALVNALAQFRHAKHEIIVFQVMDRDELEFPFKEWTQFESLEVDGDIHQIDPVAFRNAYLQKRDQFQDELTKGCHRHRIDLVPMITDQPYAEALARFLTKRLSTL
ncbi:MAG: DUF58 domain-containing protein [Verrucomicrobiales bacterium]|nr:DUF58 domain-containing protein [Verrucomicrobiales bacterium]|tara:strand:- start:88 stop:981 length:894 start_codon:yes stop_codon:yes gene_type:complete